MEQHKRSAKKDGRGVLDDKIAHRGSIRYQIRQKKADRVDQKDYRVSLL